MKFLKILKKTILWLLGIFISLVIVLALVLVYAFKHPRETWELAQKHLLPKDLRVTWETLDFSGKHISGLNFYFDLEFTNLRIEKDNPFLEIPVDLLHVEASVFPKESDARIVLHDLTVNASKDLRFRPGPPKPSPEQNPFQQARQIMELIGKVQSWTTFESIHLDVANFRLEKEETTLMALLLKADGDSVDAPLKIQAGLDLPSQKKMRVSLLADLWMKRFETADPFLESAVTFKGFGVETVQKVALIWQDEILQLETAGGVQYRKEKMRIQIDPRLKLRMDESEAQAKIEASLAGLPGPIVKINKLTADAKIPLTENIFWSEKPATFQVRAPVDLFFIDKNMRPPLEKSCQCKIPESLNVDLNGRAWPSVFFSRSAETRKLVAVDLSVESVENKLLSADLKADMLIQKKSEEFLFEPHVDSIITIHSYQGVRKFLDAKNILIPAPFDILDGTLTFKATGPVNPSPEKYNFPTDLIVDLSSPRQKIKLHNQAQISLARNLKSAFIDVKARIEDLQLELPPLDPLAGLPRVVPERRILKAPPKAKPKTPGKFNLSLAMQIETVRPGAIRLLTQYAEPLVPITVQIQKPNLKTTNGFVQTEPFDLVYLRRRVRVEKMRLGFDNIEKGVIPVDGRLVVKQTEYTVYIDVQGPIQKPAVQLSSEPYLPRSEIISVLLYDRTSDQLIGADAETVGSFDAAIADRAIGLFGLWAFASTPIRSFSYNPVTKVYAATVMLSDDLSAGVGTNWEEATQFELRKRVSRQWVLTATWAPATQDEEEQEKLVLQWEKRF